MWLGGLYPGAGVAWGCGWRVELIGASSGQVGAHLG